MTPAHDSNSSTTFDLASPTFRFPVPSAIAAEQSVLKRPQSDVSIAPAAIHEPATPVKPPHLPTSEFMPHEASRYVGWSIQDTSWTSCGDALEVEPAVPSAEMPEGVDSSTQVMHAETESPDATADELIESDLVEPAGELTATSEAPTTIPFARPLELPSRSGSAVDAATQWSASSRAQITGFAIRRTRIDQPQAVVTGAGLASAHRRWAARNHSAELQTRSATELKSLSQPNDAAHSSELHSTSEIGASLKQSRLSGGGLPLIVHPDFRWPAVVDRLALGGIFSEQLLAAAEELLSSAQGRLLVAGTRRNQGVTTMAATIARMLIEQGRRVLMVDADLASGGWTCELELQAAGSWVRQVELFEPLQAAMAISRRTSSAFVGLQAVGNRRELPPNLFDYLGQLLAPIAGQFDATIIEVGPVNQLLEELSQPLRLGSAVMIVQQQGADAAIELRRTKTTLNAFGLSRLAVAQNFAA